jgi:hypothetical protein
MSSRRVLSQDSWKYLSAIWYPRYVLSCFVGFTSSRKSCNATLTWFVFAPSSTSVTTSPCERARSSASFRIWRWWAASEFLPTERRLRFPSA